jgi:WD40 repeat protein
VSGDSQGIVRFWDSKFGVLITEFKEHENDIITIAKINNTIYCTGCDSLVISIQYNGEEWKITSKFRGQSHDINALIFLKYNYQLSLKLVMTVYYLVE